MGNWKSRLWLYILLLTSGLANAQEPAALRWEKRLVMVMAADPSDATYQEQLQLLRAAQEDLRELRIVVWQVQPERYGMGAWEKPNWLQGESLYQNYKSNRRSFECLLLGLDGGVKLRSRDIVTLDELYDLINQMPMRRAELRRRGGG